MGMARSRHGKCREIEMQTLKGPVCRSTCKCKDDITMGTGFCVHCTHTAHNTVKSMVLGTQ